MPHRRLLSFLILVLLVPAAAGQDRLLSPAEFLGYALGDRFTPHHRVVDYVEHVAAHSPNVRIERYGETNEGRPLLVAYIATPEHLAQLETIRLNNLRRAGLAEGAVSGPTAALVWLSYNVHGNESVSTEAAMQTLYDLANPANARTQAWLQHTVVILDPCINPDGRDRYVHWYNETVGRFPNPNPDAREHHEPWPGGRTNHYYFDLNRDWAWMTQRETQQRLPLYQRWMPHVHVDFHEQGVDEPYYFAPAARPYHEDITPWQRAFQTTIGQNHARYFDANGWLYFTRQRFDLFYPGYGDTWPTYQGAIGMTYEQGGSGRAGLGIITAEGDTLTLRERIEHHHTTGLSTVEITAQNAERVQQEFAAYYEQARTNPPGAYKTYLVKGTNDPDVLAALAAHLDGQGIAYGYATRARQTRGFAYRTGATGAVSVEPGDLVVSTFQPRAVLTKVLFEPRAMLEDSLSYDITAWALPYVYNVDAYALTDRIDPDTDAPPAAPAALSGAVEKPYAYIARWQSFADAQFLAALLNAGVNPRFATRPFEIDGQAYAPGTLILTRTLNEHLGATFDEVIPALAAEHRQPLHAVATGFVTTGPDFGSDDVAFLDRPHVAVLAENPVRSYAAGEVWHFFDQQLGYPVTLLHPDDLGRIDLGDYDVLVLPSGSYGRVLTDEVLADVRDWVRAGGRLIALEDAAGFLAGKSGFALQRKEAADENDEDAPAPVPYADRERRAISDAVTGAVYRVQIDGTHPLGFGVGDTYFSLKRGSEAFAFLKDGWTVGALREGAPVSGFAGHRAQQKLADTLVFGVQDLGRGAVIYMVDDPLFRAFWYGGRLLFANAVFFVGQD